MDLISDIFIAGLQGFGSYMPNEVQMVELKDGSILRLAFPSPGQESLILFSNPAHKELRKNGTIRLSMDESKAWSLSKTLVEGSFAYSCLLKLTDNEFGILFERDDYSIISSSRKRIDWLLS